MKNKIDIVFFGSSIFSTICLEELKNSGILPTLIITTPDMPTGRGLKLTSTPVKLWANKNRIECLSPAKLDSSFINILNIRSYDLFLVASYGKIIPESIINLPKYKTLNIHPSLLPKYRGPSPLQEQILNDDKNIGVSIIVLEKKVDHGPIVAQKKIIIPNWPVKFDELEKILAVEGSKLFAEILEDWVNAKISPVEQEHSKATFTKKIEKNDGLIDLEFDDSYVSFLKTKAYNPRPGTFFYINKNGQKYRIIIKDSEYLDNQFLIKRVLPEGKKEMNYNDFLRGLN